MGQACSDGKQRGGRSSPDARDARLPRGRSTSGRRLRAPERRTLGCMSDVAKTIEAVWKIESTRLIAAIARVTHDIGIAEELAQDALGDCARTLARRRHPRKSRRVADDGGQTGRHATGSGRAAAPT